MSREFTMVLSGPFTSPARVLAELEGQLALLRLRRLSPIFQAGLHEGLGVFSKIEEDSAASSAHAEVQDCREVPPEWTALTTRFRAETFSCDILLGSRGQDFLNCFIDIPDRNIRELFAHGKIHEFYAIMFAAALSMNASFGFGALELPFDPVSPEKAHEAIWRNPEEPEIPSWMGLIARKVMNNADRHLATANGFESTQIDAGFWLLEHKDYLDFYRQVLGDL